MSFKRSKINAVFSLHGNILEAVGLVHERACLPNLVFSVVIIFVYVEEDHRP